MHDVDSQLSGVFARAGLDGCVHALDLGAPREIAFRSDESASLASVGKVPILVAVMRSAADGRIDLSHRLRVPAKPRTPGPSGLSVMRDDAELSVRDLAYLMISVSDNHAADVLLGIVSPREVTATMRTLGLSQTTIEATIAESFALLHAQALPASEAASTVTVQKPPPWRSTPREMATLLSLIWSDHAGPPALCSEMRAILAAQLGSRIASGFPELGVRIAGKGGMAAVPAVKDGRLVASATLNECAVVQYPDGGRYAIALFARGEHVVPMSLDVHRAFADAARLVVDSLRSQLAA